MGEQAEHDRRTDPIHRHDVDVVIAVLRTEMLHVTSSINALTAEMKTTRENMAGEISRLYGHVTPLGDRVLKIESAGCGLVPQHTELRGRVEKLEQGRAWLAGIGAGIGAVLGVVGNRILAGIGLALLLTLGVAHGQSIKVAWDWPTNNADGTAVAGTGPYAIAGARCWQSNAYQGGWVQLGADVPYNAAPSATSAWLTIRRDLCVAQDVIQTSSGTYVRVTFAGTVSNGLGLPSDYCDPLVGWIEATKPRAPKLWRFAK